MNGVEFALVITVGLTAVVAWHFNRQRAQATNDLGECLGMFEDIRDEMGYDEWPFKLDPRYDHERRERRRVDALLLILDEAERSVEHDISCFRPLDDPRYQLGAH